MAQPYNDRLLEIIDARVRASQRSTTATGTIASLDVIGMLAMVTMDGSTLAVPVKVPGSVAAAPGDRCLLQQFGSDWVVTSAFSIRWPEDKGINIMAAAGSAAGTFANMPGTPSFPFTKRYGYTRLLWTVKITTFSATLGSRVYTQATATGPPGTFTQAVGQFQFANSTGAPPIDRLLAGWDQEQLNVPVGDYTATLQWRTDTVAPNSISVNAEDTITFRVREIGP
jgi:hypothetical protein